MSRACTQTQSAMISCLRTRVLKQPIIELYFEFGLKFYNIEAYLFPNSVIVMVNTISATQCISMMN